MATFRDGVALLTSYLGSAYTAMRANLYGVALAGGVCTTRKALVATAVGSITTAWAPASGKTVVVYGMSISVSAAVNVLLEDNSAAGANLVFQTPKLLADTPYTIEFPGGIALSAADRILKVTSSGAANLTGTFWGEEV